VNPENLGGLRLISASLAERRLNESFFKFTERLIQIDMPLDHFSDKGFQLLFHVISLELVLDFVDYYCRHNRSRVR
jgi:hypothetical protein